MQVDGNKCKTAKLVETVFRRKIDLKCGKNSFNKKEKNVKMEKKWVKDWRWNQENQKNPKRIIFSMRDV